MNAERSSTRTHLLILTCLCAVAYLPGLTNHGLTNWQEAQRALVFGQMLERSDWLVPMVHDEPYLAKPPMVYWSQLTLSALLGGRSDILPLRLTVAIAGWLGVLATYAAGRVLLLPGVPSAGRTHPLAYADEPSSLDQHTRAKTAAFLGAAMLATGLLYVRSSRIGELDILLVWPTSIAVLLAFILSTRTTTKAHTGLLSLGLLLVVACASLTKGPPALVAIACALVGGQLLCAAAHANAPAPSRRIPLIAGLLGSALCLAMLAVTGRLSSLRTNTLIGAAYIVGSVGIIAAVLTRACASPAQLLGIVRKPLPMLALLGGAATVALWIALVARRIGWDAVNAAMAFETGDNLRAFVLDAPVNNFEAMGFGVGLGSIVLIAAAIVLCLGTIQRGWHLWGRMDTGTLWLIAWVLGSLLVYSTIGKGVARYLTPIWPGAALLAGASLAWATSSLRISQAAVNTTTLGICALLALGQGWWYGYGRESRYASRSPRDLIGAVRAGAATGRDPMDTERVLALDHWSPALDYYLGTPVTPIIDSGPDIHVAGVHPLAIDDLRGIAQLAAPSPMYVIVRTDLRPGIDTRPPADRFALLGFVVLEVHGMPAYTIDNGRSATQLIELSLPEPPPD